MNQHAANTIIHSRFAGITLVLTCACLLAMQLGCSSFTQRFQSPDTEAMEFNNTVNKTTYIGDITAPMGLEKLTVDGIALVTQLDGTGSEPRDSKQRDYLIKEIQSHQIDNVTELLASKNNSMAVVMGHIPAGAREGDRFDLLVGSMPRTKTTSLESGYLMRTRMKPFINTGQNVRFGHNNGLSEGRVIVDSLFESGDKQQNELNGIILGGGTVTKDRECGLYLGPEHQSVKNTTAISRALNGRFSTHVHNSPEGVANPVTDKMIEILIPEDYRHNVGRYFHVILNIAYNETASDRVNRMEQLERELHRPETTSISAIRLEGIGEDAKSILKRGLRSNDFEIQFHSAQALAYMGDSSSADVLGKAARDEPAFRWHALTALASLKDAIAEQTLVDLFDSASAEARYGAFRTLRDSNPDSLFVSGQFVGREFMLHSVASQGEPMIHISKSKVPEIVLFGNNQRFSPNFLYIESGMTIKANGNDQVEIKKFVRGSGEQVVTCSNMISDVIQHVVALGSDYGDIIRILKDSKSTKSVESRVVINALPTIDKSYRAVAQQAEQSERYVSEQVPAMFEDSGDELRAIVAEQKKGFFGKLKKSRK